MKPWCFTIDMLSVWMKIKGCMLASCHRLSFAQQRFSRKIGRAVTTFYKYFKLIVLFLFGGTVTRHSRHLYFTFYIAIIKSSAKFCVHSRLRVRSAHFWFQAGWFCPTSFSHPFSGWGLEFLLEKWIVLDLRICHFGRLNSTISFSPIVGFNCATTVWNETSNPIEQVTSKWQLSSWNLSDSEETFDLPPTLAPSWPSAKLGIGKRRLSGQDSGQRAWTGGTWIGWAALPLRRAGTGPAGQCFCFNL